MVSCGEATDHQVTSIKLREVVRPHIPRVTPGELAVFVAAFALVAGVRIALWLLPSRVILRLVRRLAASSARERRSRIAPSLVIWAVDAARRRVPRATCLTQALSAKILLRGFGYASQLCLGVAREGDGGFRAHAWLERNGHPIVGGASIHSFVRLPELQSTPDVRTLLTH
jgi:hypothetical protein